MFTTLNLVHIFTANTPEMKHLDKHPLAEALIFDLDGTLSNSLPIHVKAWKMVTAQFDCVFNEDMMAELTGRPTIDFANRVKQENQRPDLDANVMVQLKHQYFRENLDHLEPIQAVLDLVHRYHGKIPLSVGTGANKKSALTQLEKLGIIQKFDVIITAEDVKTHKPEPETFLRCAELMGIPAKKCHVYEDGELGIQAAEKAGMFVTDVKPFYSI